MQITKLHRQFRRYCAIEENLSPYTIKSMESATKTLLSRTEAININDITEGLLREFFWLGKEKYQWSYYSYMNHYKYLKKFLNWCITHEYIKTNPVLKIGKPKKPQQLPRRLTYDEGQKVLYTSFHCKWCYHFEHPRNHAIIAMLLFTGMRAKELLNLTMLDVNLQSGTIIIKGGKGNKDRYIPIHYKLKYILQRYLDDRRRLNKTAFSFFTGIRGNMPMNYKALRIICKRISKESGVYFTPHCLRHTFASVAVEQGIGLPQLQDILGHSSITSTMIYLKMSAQNLKDSLEKLDLF